MRALGKALPRNAKHLASSSSAERLTSFPGPGLTTPEPNKSQLGMPVLAVGGGGHGGMGQFEIEQMRDYADNVEGHIIDGCGHWVPEEAPDALNPLVIEFLTRG